MKENSIYTTISYKIRVPLELADGVFKDISHRLTTMWMPHRSNGAYLLPEMETKTEGVICYEMESTSFRSAFQESLDAAKYFLLLQVALLKYQEGKLDWAVMKIVEREDDWYLIEGGVESSFTSLNISTGGKGVNL